MADIKEEFKQRYEQFYYKHALKIIKEYNVDLNNRIKKILRNFGIILTVSFFVMVWFAGFFSFNNAKMFLIVFVLSIPLGYGLLKLFNPAKQEENSLKKMLMGSFLEIFGSINWKSGIDIGQQDLKEQSNLIFPKHFTLVFDDCFGGKYRDDVEVFIRECQTEKCSFLTILPLILPIFGCSLVIGLLVFFTILAITMAVMHTNEISGQPANIISYIAIGLMLGIPLIISFILIRSSINKGNFQGLLIESNFPKNFKGSTYIYESNLLSNNTVDFKKLNKYENVELEDIEINRSYNIRSTNQIEARYIFTTSFIERFKNIKKVFKAKYVRASFYNNRMVIVMNIGKDLFYINQFKKLTKKDFDNIFEELCSVFLLVEELKLNQKIGL